jgi:hypothetical protein
MTLFYIEVLMGLTEFQIINKVVKLSKTELKDIPIVIFQRDNGDFSWCIESEYIFDESKIAGRYLNGGLAPS